MHTFVAYFFGFHGVGCLVVGSFFVCLSFPLPSQFICVRASILRVWCTFSFNLPQNSLPFRWLAAHIWLLLIHFIKLHTIPHLLSAFPHFYLPANLHIPNLRWKRKKNWLQQHHWNGFDHFYHCKTFILIILNSAFASRKSWKNGLHASLSFA